MLLVHGGVHGAACVLGISENAIYKRLKDEGLRQRYDQMQSMIVSTATAAMVSALNKAINALVSVLEDKDASAGLKVNAANALLNHCNRYIETANIMKRLETLENQMKERDNHE